MIAAIEWIPAGRANPTPSKYEYSRAEQEFLEKVQAGELGEEANENDEEWEDVDDDASEEQQQEEVEVPAVDPESLPADLRMDDYSDDEDGEDKVGGLLVGKVRFFVFNLMCANLSFHRDNIETLTYMYVSYLYIAAFFISKCWWCHLQNISIIRNDDDTS